jgi:hypothetical protein
MTQRPPLIGAFLLRESSLTVARLRRGAQGGGSGRAQAVVVRPSFGSVTLPKSSGPGTVGSFLQYKLHEADGSEAGEAHYAFLVEPGETIIAGPGRTLLVV